VLALIFFLVIQNSQVIMPFEEIRNDDGKVVALKRMHAAPAAPALIEWLVTEIGQHGNMEYYIYGSEDKVRASFPRVQIFQESEKAYKAIADAMIVGTYIARQTSRYAR
jgi:hypothetical protein